ncbi:Fc.00g029070.m01.CDS01 [Cosmosporella sp. VM-42]
MGLKQFKQDIAEAQATVINKVSNLHKGDEGELVFTYSFDDRGPLEIQALATGIYLYWILIRYIEANSGRTDVDSYPKNSEFLIFTSSDHVEQDVERYLQGLAAYAKGKDVLDLLQIVSRKLTAKFGARSTGGSTSPSVEPTDDEHDISSDSGFDDEDYSEMHDEMSVDLDEMPFRRPATSPPVYNQENSWRLKRDLEAAKAAGFRIGVLSPGSDKTLFSLSISVSKLRIPNEALEAWDLKPSEYIVMLMSLRMGYVSVPQFLRLPSDQTKVQFRFGKCIKFKPSLASARSTFGYSAENDGVQDGVESQDSGSPFSPLYMSSSLDPLLNQEFPSLLRFRRSENVSWDQAQIFRFNLSRADHRSKYEKGLLAMEEVEVNDGEPSTERLVAGFFHDYALDEDESLSIPLAAMQFGLQRLVRCTDYCMVCHKKVNGGFDAVKPYVCGDPLCLYQYLSLGFGQRIEHEIINSPYVVDLLISFFYSAISYQSLREFPRGLGLKWAFTGGPGAVTSHIKAKVSFGLSTLRFNYADYSSYGSIREDDSVLIVVNRPDSGSVVPAITAYSERHMCIIDGIQGESYTFHIAATYTAPHNMQPPATGTTPTVASTGTSEWTSVLVFKCDKYIDDLEIGDQVAKLTEMAKAIPPVLEMRKWLVEDPGRRLSSWKRMGASTLTLLNWIVASNRSFIVQDAPVPSVGAQQNDNGHKVIGLDEDWMQFRFAQGSPEKETIFIQELEKLNALHGSQHPHPSLFAWHGSPLKNWHSIIRSGLDFVNMAHGRSFGHGVYFSNQFATSMAYAGRIFGGSLPGMSWPNSVLNISSAMSICEVVNQPEKFVSWNPHYVVNQVEWIQCRYLFVHVKPMDEAIQEPWPKPSSSVPLGYIQQDPQRRIFGTIQGKSTDIQIPLSAIPVRRRNALKNELSNIDVVMDLAGSSANDPIILDNEGGEDTDDDDLDIIIPGPEMVRKRQHPSDDFAEGTRPSKLTTAIQGIKNPGHDQGDVVDYDNLTDFASGRLDLDTLPKLSEPTWASSSPAALKRLNREIRDLHKIQTCADLRKLGWYIDFDKLTNLFHWIVELHSFETSIPLGQDMKRLSCQSIVLELRFSGSFPMSPPFVRVVRPRFVPFAQGGGGHILAGGSICTELLTNSGWSPALSLEQIFLQVRLQLTETNPPARLMSNAMGTYGIGEAMGSYRQAVAAHGWKAPEDLSTLELSFQEVHK